VVVATRSLGCGGKGDAPVEAVQPTIPVTELTIISNASRILTILPFFLELRFKDIFSPSCFTERQN